MILAAGFLSPSRVPFDLLYASARVIPTPDNFPGTNTAEGAKVRQDAQQEKEQKETVKNLAMKHLMSFGIFEELAEEDCYTVHE